MVGSWELRELWSSLCQSLPVEPVRVHSAPPLASSQSLHIRCLSEAWMILSKLLGGSYPEAPHTALAGRAWGTEREWERTRVPFHFVSDVTALALGEKVKQMW